MSMYGKPPSSIAALAAAAYFLDLLLLPSASSPPPITTATAANTASPLTTPLPPPPPFLTLTPISNTSVKNFSLTNGSYDNFHVTIETQHQSPPPPGATNIPILRRDLALLLSRPSVDIDLCRKTLAHLSPHLLDRLLLDLRQAIKPLPALRFFSFTSDRCGFCFTPRSYCILFHALLQSNLAAQSFIS